DDDLHDLSRRRQNIQLHFNARALDISEHLRQQSTLPARILFHGTRRCKEIAEQDRIHRLIQETINEIVPEILVGQVDYPEIKITGCIPAIIKQVGRGVDGQLVTLATNGIGENMSLQGVVRDHTDTRAAGGHELTFSRAWVSSSWIVLSSSPS